jgi:membrane associated rhomboid family serine protease
MPAADTEFTDDRGAPGTTVVVRWLIAANIAVYFLQLTVLSAADVRGALGFPAGGLDAWWAVFTHMFAHWGLAHVALSVYVLWLLGPRVEARWGAGNFAGYYVLCGLGGLFVHLLFVRQGVLVGASGAVLGVALAAAAQHPSERIPLFGLIRPTARWALAIIVAVTLFVAGASDGTASFGYLAHAGGLLVGWLYLSAVGSVDIDRLRRRVAPIADEPEDVPPRAVPPRSLPRHRSDREVREVREVDDIVQQSQAAVAERAADLSRAGTLSLAAPSPGPPALPTDDDLNALLDKISAHGLDALTPAERDRLQDAARRLRNT